MVINGRALLMTAPIIDMLTSKVQALPASYGLTECGYDIRIKQDVLFKWMKPFNSKKAKMHVCVDGQSFSRGRFVLASSIEQFQMPTHLMGQVLNKSTWARLGLDASMTTNIEPGWNGFLTLELTYHGQEELFIPAGSGICQVMFHELAEHGSYKGKYQNQADEPVEAITKTACEHDWRSSDSSFFDLVCKKCGITD